MTKNKGSASLALIIIALLVLGGGYWVWQKGDNNKTPPPVIYTNEQVDEINSWKTYRNDEYGFEVKYPSELLQEFDYYNHAIEPGLIFGLSLKSTIPHGSDPGSLTQPFTVTVTQENSENKLIQQLMEKSPDFTDPKLTIITLSSGLSGKQITRKYIYPVEYRDAKESKYGFEITTLLTKQPYIYSVGLVPHLISTKEIEIYNQILSTFRFTK